MGKGQHQYCRSAVVLGLAPLDGCQRLRTLPHWQHSRVSTACNRRNTTPRNSPQVLRMAVLVLVVGAWGSGPQQALATPLEPSHVHVSLAQSTNDALFVSWTIDVKPDSPFSTPIDLPVNQCVRFRAVGSGTSSQGEAWAQAEGVAHSFQGATRGNWVGTLYTAIVAPVVPGSAYEYNIAGCDEPTGSSRESRLLRVPSLGRASRAGVTRIVVFGDMGVSEHATRMVAQLSREVTGGMVDAVLHLGDFGYNLPDPQGRNWDIAEDWYIALKQRSWDYWQAMVTPIAGSLPYMTLPGNHETAPFDLGLLPYLHRLPMPFHPEPQSVLKSLLAAPGTDSPVAPSATLYYSFNVGTAHFVMLNSEGSEVMDPPQLTWLEKDLQGVNRGVTPWVILCTHRPMYSSAKKQGSHLGLRSALEPLLDKYNVQLTFSGHDHSYERARPLDSRRASGMLNEFGIPLVGTVHIRVGTAGLDHLSKWATAEPPQWSIKRDLAYGYGRLSLFDSGDLMFEFVRTEWVRGHGVAGTEAEAFMDHVTGTVDMVRLPRPVGFRGVRAGRLLRGSDPVATPFPSADGGHRDWPASGAEAPVGVVPQGGQTPQPADGGSAASSTASNSLSLGPWLVAIAVAVILWRSQKCPGPLGNFKHTPGRTWTGRKRSLSPIPE